VHSAANDAMPRVVRRIIVDTNSWYYTRTLQTFAMALCNRRYVILSAFLAALCKTRIVGTIGVVYKGNVYQISATWLLLTLVCGMQIMIEWYKETFVTGKYTGDTSLVKSCLTKYFATLWFFIRIM